MSDWYCDISKVSAADYAAPVSAGTVPTKSEDGNGKAIGVAAMATLVITFTGLPVANEAITIGGVTFTAKAAAGAGTNEFTIGVDASATATNLAAKINGTSSANSNIINPTMSACPLKNAVNATVSAGVITVYSRISGSEWNSVTETENLTNASITAQWSGGSDGAWGYFFNPSALAWPSNVSAGAYGAFVATYLGTPVAGDIIHIRTSRNAADLTLQMTTSAITVTSRAIGTDALPLVFLADNGVKWSGDAGVFIIALDGSQNVNRSILVGAAVRQIWAGVNLTDTTRNWRFQITGALVGANYTFCLVNSLFGAAVASVVKLKSMEITGASGGMLNNTNAAYAYVNLSSPLTTSSPTDAPNLFCEDLIIKSAAKQGSVLHNNSPYSASVLLKNCVFDATNLTSAATDAILNGAGSGGNGVWRFTFEGCRWINFPATTNQSGFQKISLNKQIQVILRDCTYTNIKVSGGPSNGGLIGLTMPTVANSDQLQSINIESSLASRFGGFETARKSMFWLDSAAPRTTTSLLPDGTTTFSLRVAVTSISGEVTKGKPAAFPRIQKLNSLADGTRTATLRLLVDNNIRTALGSRDPYNNEMWIEVSYCGTDGLPKRVSSQCAITGTPAALTAGTAGDWSAVAYDVNGVTHNYTAFSISVSCPNVATLTELGLRFAMGCQTTSTDDLVILDTEWALA